MAYVLKCGFSLFDDGVQRARTQAEISDSGRHREIAVPAPESVFSTVQSINMPAFTFELLIDRLSPDWPAESTPWGLDFEAWRAIIFPIYCLPFWWLAGLGIDTLSRRRILGWPMLLFGTLLCGFFLFIALGLTFGVPAEDHKGMSWVFYGLALWIALFSTFPATWTRQGIASRRNRTSTAPKSA